MTQVLWSFSGIVAERLQSYFSSVYYYSSLIIIDNNLDVHDVVYFDKIMLTVL